MTQADRPVIETQGLTKRFSPRRNWLFRSTEGKGKVAVSDVTLSVGRGEIFGLIGPNGAGKTTLIRMLSTLLIPTEGTAAIDGHDVVKADHLVRTLVGTVSSNERSFYWRLTGRQNLMFFADLYHLNTHDRKHWVNELIDVLDLKRIIDHRFDRYSTGQKQRMSIARGLLNKPRVLLMDEPTKGVDPVGAEKLVTVIREQIIPQWSPTILVTSHNLAEIEKLCRRIGLMAEGRLIAMGSVEELRTMVDTTTTYRLYIRSLDPESIRSAASAAGCLTDPVLRPAPDGIDAQISFTTGSDGFSRLVRTLIESGGDIVTCTSAQASFEAVFHKLVAERAAASAVAD